MYAPVPPEVKAFSNMWTPNAFGDAHAEIYDQLLANLPDTSDTVNALAGEDGIRLLEFGLGTGRLAIPLAARGVSVTSIEISEPMIKIMKSKPGAERVSIHQGDYTYFTLEEQFDIVLLSRNTLVGSPDQDLQVKIMCNAARHLSPAGKIYVDLGMPRPSGSSDIQYGREIENGVVFLQRYINTITQQIDFRRVILTDGKPRVMSRHTRYIWPAELDLMATIAGLKLFRRTADWLGNDLMESSDAFLSIYEHQNA
jgi:SAM-dependent methyltransferase